MKNYVEGAPCRVVGFDNSARPGGPRAQTSAWLLRTSSNKDLVLRTELDYFQDHFDGRPMGDAWTPPAIRVDGKRKKVRDFVSWMTAAPVLSQKAVDCLRDLLQPHCEIMPLMVIRRKQFFAINVLTSTDCVDTVKSNILYADDDPGKVLSVKEVVFRDDVKLNVPIFKWTGYTGQVYVTRPFVDRVIAYDLRGAAFLDPSVSPFRFILQGRSVNCVEEYDSEA